LLEADIVSTATTSSVPVFQDIDLKPGVHINAVGSFTPAMQEVPGETVARSRIFVDSRDAALAEAGDLILPIEGGLLPRDQVFSEIGEVVTGKRPGRQSIDEITLFKSVGVAVQDAAAASLALENAYRLGLGQEVAW
jgi:ornithine cyclodeaminase